jgi:DNA polymerase-3 subunit gamma/tau
MRGQAARSGQAWLSRAADLMAAALVEMRGTTSTRLVLELAAARVLLPGAASDIAALLARLDRMERRLAATGVPGSPPPATAPAPAPAPAPAEAAPEPAASVPARPAAVEAQSTPTASAAEVAEDVEPADPPPAAVAPVAAAPGGVATGGVDAAAVRRLWDDVLDAVKLQSRVAFTMLSQYAKVLDADAKTVTLEFTPALFAKQFDEGKAEIFRTALKAVAGLDLRLVTVGAAAAPAAVPVSSNPRANATAAESEPDEIDDDTEPGEPASPRQDPQDAALALLQSGLGAQVIGEIDHS